MHSEEGVSGGDVGEEERIQEQPELREILRGIGLERKVELEYEGEIANTLLEFDVSLVVICRECIDHWRTVRSRKK